MINIIIIISILITGICNAEEFNGKVLMRVNGHKYLMDDLLGKTLINEWNKNRGSFRDDITLGKIKKLKYKTVPGSPDVVKLYLTIERSKFCKYKVCGYVDIEDVIITLNKVVTNRGWCLVTDEAVQVGDIDIFFNNSGFGIINGFLDLIMNAIIDIFLEFPAWIAEQVQGYTVRFNADQETIVLIPLKTFAESGHSIVVQDTLTEIQDLINSFPINITFDYESNTVINNPQTGAHTNYDGLVIDIELMPGYGNNLTQYMPGNPALPSNPVLLRGGFAMKGDNYPAIDIDGKENLFNCAIFHFYVI